MDYVLEILLLVCSKERTLNGKQSGNEKVLVIPLSTSFALLASVLKERRESTATSPTSVYSK
jgi:hypothetical protein